MRYLKIFISLSLIFLILSCSSVEEGFKNQRKENSDEFLVEKKSPLVLPPNYDELPLPSANQQLIEEDENTIKSLLSNSDNNKTDSEIKKDTTKNLEKFLLDKIKKN